MATDDQNKKPRELGEPVGEHVRIFQRDGKGNWYANYQHAGKQIRASLKTKNKKQAVKEAMKLDIQLQEGTYQQKAATKSLAEAIEIYLAQCEVSGLTTETINNYTRVLSSIAEVDGAKNRTKLSHIDLVFIDAFKLFRASGIKPVSLATIHKEVMIIRVFINWCLARKYLREDPLTGLNFSQPKSAEQPWWLWDVVHGIVGASTETVQPAFAILAYTGMRYAELQWLTWEDINFDQNNIYIQPKEGWSPKSGDQRVMPIMPELLPVLQSLPRDSKWVIPMMVSKQQPVAGKQLTDNALLKRLKRVLKKLGLEGHIHTFRHSFISYCVYRGIPEAIIRSWVGHVDAKILWRYTHIHSKQSQEAMKSLSQIVQPPSPETGGEEKKSA